MITFYEYMKQSLGNPSSGYYTSRARIGFEGADFFTAPERSPAFASLLALQIMELDETMGFPDPFYLIEAGPGNGTLAFSLLTIFQAANPGFFERISPIFYELPGILTERQKEKLSGFHLRHLPQWISPESTSPFPEPEGGLVFGNEFLDALPVHRLRMGQEGWRECYVAREGNDVEEIWGELSTDSLARELDGMFGKGNEPGVGQEVEVCFEMPSVLGTLDRLLSRGFMLWIDYGDIRDELYSERRKKGTLLSYRDHRVSENLLERSAGQSDLTAFVDFSRVSSILSGLGYSFSGYTDQMSWLMGLGFQDWLEANADRLTPEDTLRSGTLLHPLKMGRIFKVLLMSKEVSHGTFNGFRFGGLRPPL